MEILQQLRRPRALAVLLLLLPLLVALLTHLHLQRQPPQYLGEARVIVPSEAATSASGVGLYIADFSVLVASQETVEAVTAATQVPADRLRDGLEVNREGQSSLFTVTYTTAAPDTAEPVLRIAITTTMARMAPTSDAESRLEQAQVAHADAQNQLRAFQDSIGLLFPHREYNDLSSQIRFLQSSPNPADQGLRQQLLTRRDALVPQVRTYDELNDRLDQAAAELRDAERAAAASAGAAANVREGRPIQRITITAAPSSQLVQAVGVGAALGLLGGIVLVAGPDLLPGGRRRQPVRTRPAAERPELALRPAKAARARAGQPAEPARARASKPGEPAGARAVREVVPP